MTTKQINLPVPGNTPLNKYSGLFGIQELFTKDETIFLVDWETFGDKIEQIFSARKNHQTAIVIYAKPASIPQEKMSDIANRANTVVVNFRGRLLNDILTSLITTSYDRN